MPPRRVVDDPAAELERRREQTRARVKRYRERRNATGNASVAPQGTPGNVTPPQTPPVSPPSLTEMERLLREFGRGYRHDEKRLRKLLTDFPRLDMEEELGDALDWLDRVENKKRALSIGYLRNWCKRSDEKRKREQQAPPPASPPKGLMVNGVYHPPAAFQRNPGPPPEDTVPLTAPLETFTREELARLREEQARASWKDRLAALAARATNGRHP